MQRRGLFRQSAALAGVQGFMLFVLFQAGAFFRVGRYVQWALSDEGFQG